MSLDTLLFNKKREFVFVIKGDLQKVDVINGYLQKEERSTLNIV